MALAYAWGDPVAPLHAACVELSRGGDSSQYTTAGVVEFTTAAAADADAAAAVAARAVAAAVAAAAAAAAHTAAAHTAAAAHTTAAATATAEDGAFDIVLEDKAHDILLEDGAEDGALDILLEDGAFDVVLCADLLYDPSLQHLGLQPRRHTVAASETYGCSLWYMRLQVRPIAPASAARGDRRPGATRQHGRRAPVHVPSASDARGRLAPRLLARNVT